jgi:hypothetical protein
MNIYEKNAAASDLEGNDRAASRIGAGGIRAVQVIPAASTRT